MSNLPADDDDAWRSWASEWRLREDTVYLNHGSFGPPPERVRQARADWQQRLDRQPMDFFVRQYEPAWLAARCELARFLNTGDESLILTENATSAMNVLAASFPLAAGDEVLLNDHEYGAVLRIWQRACRRAGAREPVVVGLPWPVDSPEEIVAAILAGVTERTRLIVVSHITSPTAMILPVGEIVRRARAQGVPVCIDGPHAPGQVPLDLGSLECDFYAASGHKWLCAPFGTGWLYVHPRHQNQIEPPQLSWGRIPPEPRVRWWDEFVWSGTRDPSSWLALPAAIHFMESVGGEAFRARTHHLAGYARQRLEEQLGTRGAVPDSPEWYGSMAHVPLPPGDARSLQQALWERYGIEVPVIEFGGRRWIRVSCHLYNTHRDIDRLLEALAELVT